jgi:hypothetical protein
MERENFKIEAKKSIDVIFKKIEDLEATKDGIKESVKAKYDEKLSELKHQKNDLQAKHDELAVASDDKWEEVKTAFSSAKNSFKEGFSKIGSLI